MNKSGPTNDAPTGSVTISGSAIQGQTLTASNTVRDDDGIPTSGSGALQYQWLANGQNIVGATNSTLTLDQSHLGKTISVRAGYTDNFGVAESVTSSITSAVTAPRDLGQLEQLTATAGYAIRATDSFAAWKAFHAGSDSIDSRITDFNGNMMYVWEPSNLVLKTNTLDLPVYEPSSQGQRIVTENAMPIVLDFSGGAKTVIIDISPRLASQYFFVFKNFEADDSFKFTYISQSQKPDGSWTPSYDDFPHEIRSTNNFTNQAAFESSGKAMLASKTLGTGNALFIQDATLTFSDLPSSMVKSGVLSVTEPQKAEIRTVGVLALDVFSSEPRDVNYPIFDRYLGMGADGRADFLISFVGTLPSSMSVDLVFGPTLLAG